MKIDALYKGYFQKSKIFLYPFLDIKRGTSIIPVDTYVSVDGLYTTEDMKFICIYHARKDKEYLQFQKEVLMCHPRLHDYTVLDSNQEMYIFDFSDFGEDWYKIISGKYSKIDKKLKCKIRDYFDRHSMNYRYVNSFLYPEKFFEQYAKLFDVEESLLRSVGELCDPFDLEKERLQIKVANLQNIKILT